MTETEKSLVLPQEEEDTSMSSTVREEGLGNEGHRLMISKIVCENFKSYAGVKELGPFHKVQPRSSMSSSSNKISTVEKLGWHW